MNLQNTQRAVARFGGWLEALLFAAASALLVAMGTLLFLQVVYRYGLERPLPWSEEGARYMLVWFALLSACVAARRGQHFVFRWATIWLPKPIQSVLEDTVKAVTCISLLVLVIAAWSYLDVLEGLHATATQIDMRIPYGALPVSFGALCLVYALELADSILGRFTGQRLSEWSANERAVSSEFFGNDVPAPADVLPAPAGTHALK